MSYAQGTEVSPDKSRSEIERTLRRYGADGFAYGWEGVKAMVGFRMEGRQVRFMLTMPAFEDFTISPAGRKRTRAATEKAWEQESRRRWRALALVIKAKLEAVDTGIAEFDTEFMGFIVLPDGSTVGDFMGPQIERAYETAEMPTMLPQLGPGSE